MSRSLEGSRVKGLSGVALDKGHHVLNLVGQVLYVCVRHLLGDIQDKQIFFEMARQQFHDSHTATTGTGRRN